MKRPLLYTYRRCPFAIRARMALLQASIEYDAYEIDLKAKPPVLMAISPKGTVPVLLLPQGQVIEESLDIMRWAFGDHDLDGWWSRAQSLENRSLIALNDGPFKQQLDRYKYPHRVAGTDPAAHRDLGVKYLLHPLEHRLGGAAFLGGAQPCAADLAIFPFIRQFRAIDPAWFDANSLPATQRWLQAWLDGDQFKTCMQKPPRARGMNA